MPNFAMMKSASTFSFFASMFAFILILTCVFSGDSPAVYPEGQLVTLDISRLGQTPLLKDAKCKRGILADVTDTTGSIGHDVASVINSTKCEAESKINTLVAAAAHGVISASNVPDFFDVHVFNYCQGKFLNRTTIRHRLFERRKIVTKCSAVSPHFSFDPTQIVQQSLPANVSLDDIKWPANITKVQNELRLSSKILVVTYPMSVVMTGMTAMLSVSGMCGGPVSLGAHVFFFSTLAFITLTVSSLASSVTIIKAVTMINSKGNGIGISARAGGFFVSMTWLATSVLLLVVLVNIAHSISNRRLGQAGYVERPYMK